MSKKVISYFEDDIGYRYYCENCDEEIEYYGSTLPFTCPFCLLKLEELESV